jgi:flagellar FliL protein
MSAKPPKPKKEKKGKKGAAPSEGDEAAAVAPEGAEGAEGDAAPKKKLAGKTLILFIALPLLLLGLGGGAAAVMFLGKKPAEAHAAEDGHGEKDGKEKHAKKEKKDKKKEKGGHGGKEGEGGPAITEGPDGVAYYEMPAVFVNIQSESERPTYLKLKLSVQFEDAETAEVLTEKMPVLTDQFQTFLRELRVEDISGSAGTYRLRMELLRRVNLAMTPDQASAVLIEEMLVQ